MTQELPRQLEGQLGEIGSASVKTTDRPRPAPAALRRSEITVLFDLAQEVRRFALQAQPGLLHCIRGHGALLCVQLSDASAATAASSQEKYSSLSWEYGPRSEVPM